MSKDKKNTGKAPSVQFYYKDFLADMQEHPPEIVGAWMLVLIKIWHTKSNGEITLNITQLARVMNTTVGQAQEYVTYFNAENIADVTNDNGKITIVNRRAKRDAKLIENNRLRQQAHRGKHKNNGDVTDETPNPSSSTPTSTPTPTSTIGIGIEQEPSNGEELELKKEVQLKALKFTDELGQKFHSLSTDEATTFSRIAQYLSDLVRRSQVGMEIFDKALGWADEATSIGARSPKAVFVAKVKQETGYTGRGRVLA